VFPRPSRSLIPPGISHSVSQRPSPTGRRIAVSVPNSRTAESRALSSRDGSRNWTESITMCSDPSGRSRMSSSPSIHNGESGADKVSNQASRTDSARSESAAATPACSTPQMNTAPSTALPSIRVILIRSLSSRVVTARRPACARTSTKHGPYRRDPMMPPPANVPRIPRAARSGSGAAIARIRPFAYICASCSIH